MRSRTAIIAASLLSLVAVDQAHADSAGAAFVGGLIGGAIGGAISNSQRTYHAPRVRRSQPRSAPARKSTAPRAAAAATAPALTWMAFPMQAAA